MNVQQINKSRMYGATITVLDNNLPLFGKMDELTAAHRQLKERMLQIDQHRLIQEVNNSGLTRNKGFLRKELTTLLLRVSNALTAYAAAKNDLVLLAKVEYSDSDLRKASDRILGDIAEVINEIASTSGADLQTWFVGPDELAEFNRLTNDFKAALPLRRAAANISKASTSNISEVFHSIDLLLKTKIDLQLKPFRFTQPDFYKAYRNARALVNYTGRGKAVVAA